MQASCRLFQASCRLHAGFMHRLHIGLMLSSSCRLYSEFMQAFCSLHAGMFGGRGGSIGRASASSGFHGQRFESRPEHKNNL